MVKICRPWITKGGKRLYARNYGKKAFCFYVDSATKKVEPSIDDSTVKPS